MAANNYNLESKCQRKVRVCACTKYISVSQTVLLTGPFWLRKITTDPHVNTVRQDGRYPKRKICISELILRSYEYTAVAYVTMHCMI